MNSVSQNTATATVDAPTQANYQNLLNRAFRHQAFVEQNTTENLDYDWHSNGPVEDKLFYRENATTQSCIVLVSGPPGSGKTTWANAHFLNVFSTDNYMTVDGQYQFDRNRIGHAHRQCEDDVMEALGEGKCVVYCNTNTQFSDFRNIIFKIRRKFDNFPDFSCMVVYAKMADCQVDTLEERVGENGNRHLVETYKLHNYRNRWNWMFLTFDPKHLSWCRILGYIVPTHRMLRENNCFSFPGPYMSAQHTGNDFGSDIASDLSSPRNNRTHYHRRYNNNGRGRGRGRERGRGRGNFNRNYHNQGRNQGRNERREN